MLIEAGAPAHLVAALDDGADPDLVIGQLVAAGVLPGPDDALAGLLDGWTPLLRRGVGPLDAELTGYDFLAVLRSAQPADDLPPLLVDLVAHAESHGGAAALAMLRVLGRVGPVELRPAASGAADRLVAAGLPDRPWAAGLGAPAVGPCFGYADTAGAQEAVAVTYRYGRKEHAIAVLIDHDLGGRVKDCWPTAEPDRIRADYRQVAGRFGLRFRDYEPAEAAAILRGALDRPPCPVQPDQVADVDTYLDLLRRRVALLPADNDGALGATRPSTRPSTRIARPVGAGTSTVHRVKITLRGSKPPIWRRLEVPSGLTLQTLNRVIQAAFGWEDHHLWVFDTTAGRYGRPDPELGHRSAAARKLRDVAPAVGDRLRYTYDFGDNWEHDIVVEEVHAAEPGHSYPRCVTGRRAAPPEDCGGPWGYDELVRVLADPADPDHAERLEWLGLASAASFDPAHFDRDEVNRALSDLTPARTRR